MTKLVADLSKWNTVTNYQKLCQEFDGFILRAGYRGSSTGKIALDEKFIPTVQGILKADPNAHIGVYFFTTAITVAEAFEEAIWTITACKNVGFTPHFPIIVDTEWCNKNKNGRSDKLDKATRTQMVTAFCEMCHSQGYEAAIYASDSWFTSQLDPTVISKYKIWNASYSKRPYRHTTNMIGWQRSSSYQSAGTSAPIDISEWYEIPCVEATQYGVQPVATAPTPVAPAPVEEPKKLVDGMKITLSNAPLYASSTTAKVAKKISGEYYIWSSAIKGNNRIRITTKSSYVGNVSKVTGWVDVSSVK